MSPKNSSVYRINAVAATLDILDLYLQSNEAALGVTEISQRTGIDKSRVYRILRTLAEGGYLELTQDHSYGLSLRFLELGELVKKQLDLQRVAEPLLAKLAHECGDTVLLNVRDGADAVCIYQHHGDHVLQVTDRIRRRTSLHAGASPRVLLAFVPPIEQDAILREIELKPFTPFTINQKGDLIKSLEQILIQAYAVNDEELDLGVSAVAAPVWDRTGTVIAAISIVGPKDRFQPPRRQQLIDSVVSYGLQVSRELGYSGQSFSSSYGATGVTVKTVDS